jgi:hypothetical protein
MPESNLKNELKSRLLTYIGGGFGLVAGLAWNEAIKGFIDYVFPLQKDSLAIKFIYALIITIVVVILIWYLEKLFKPKSEGGIDMK